MSICPDFNLDKKISSLFSGLGLSTHDLLNTDLNAFNSAKLNGIFNFPLAQQLIQDATAFLSSVITGVGSTGVNQAVQALQIKGSMMVEGAIVTLIASIATLGSQFQGLAYALLANQLKQELQIRSVYYMVIISLIKQLLMIFKEYAFQSPGNFYRISNALSHVKRAEMLFSKIYSDAKNPSIAPRTQVYILKRAFAEVDFAIRILDTENELGKPIPTQNPKTYMKYLQRAFNAQVLGKSIGRIEKLTWIASHIASLFPMPVPVTLYTGNLTASIEKNLPGYIKPDFRPDLLETKLNNIKRSECRDKNIQILDLNKGLLATDATIDQLVSQLIDFDVDWEQLEKASLAFMNVMSPAYSMTKDVRQSMEGAYGDQELVLAGKIVMWLGELTLISQLNIIPKNAKSPISAVDMASLKKKLILFKALSVDGKIERFLIQCIEAIAIAPLNRRALQEALVLCTTGLKLVQKGYFQDQQLVYELGQISPESIPGVAFMMQLITAMETLPPPASTMANGLRTGQLQSVAQGVSTAVKTLSVGSAVAHKLFDFVCEDETPSALDKEQNLCSNYYGSLRIQKEKAT